MKTAKVKKTFLYPDIKGAEFQTLVAKLGRAPTQVARANRIKVFLDGIDKVWEDIHEEFKSQLLEKYATKDDTGKLVIDEAGNYKIPEENQAAFNEAYAEFQKKSVDVECLPLTADTLADIKLTGRDLQLLGDIYVNETGPGVPHIGLAQ